MAAPYLVGTVHLPPLPGSARGRNASEIGMILDRARSDALRYAEGGFDAVIVENFGDVPFVKDPASTCCAMMC
jgi:predicted TIM-barrel enzyme